MRCLPNPSRVDLERLASDSAAHGSGCLAPPRLPLRSSICSDLRGNSGQSWSMSYTRNHQTCNWHERCCRSH
eukprot:9712564-Lingulodinium_polyedra.AAC.1